MHVIVLAEQQALHLTSQSYSRDCAVKQSRLLSQGRIGYLNSIPWQKILKESSKCIFERCCPSTQGAKVLLQTCAAG